MFKNIAEKLGFALKNSDTILAGVVVCILFLLVIPLTGFLIDALIAISICISVLVLLITLYTDEAISFSALPSFLLFLTLFRLGLNIATTRMILTEAHAGQIIQTFGEVVTGGNQFVGFIIFLLITGVNFVVITKGSGRVAEVAARFTLDSLPGKQLAIDADVSAGLIDEQEAKLRRDKIMVEADFYGAMDGASKFVRGDAIAGIVITLVNIIGGFIVGMVMKGMSWQQVVNVYVTLTVGDGLVTQIPALLVSVGAGIIVTRSSAKEDLAESLRLQMFNNPKVLSITGGILLMLGLIPGMPLFVIATVSFTLFLYAYFLGRKYRENAFSSQKEGVLKESSLRKMEEVDKILFIDPMEIELGHRLTPLVNEQIEDNLQSRISLIRHQIATELGIVVPSIRIHDNRKLDPETYMIKIKGNEVASAKLHLNKFLAMNPGNVIKKIHGEETLEPAFGFASTWILPRQKEQAISAGYIVVDPLSILTTHLTEVIYSHAHELLNRQEASKLVENARQYASTVIDELLPTKLGLGQILRVLQNLLRERIPIRDFTSILEILADQSLNTSDPDVLSEYVRQGMARHITKQNLNIDHALHVITLDPKVEQMLLESIQKNELGKKIMINPVMTRKVIDETTQIINEGVQQGIRPVFLTNPTLRPYFKKLIERAFPKISVLSHYEIVPEVSLKTTGTISADVLSL
jgi:flagellar biosynthesis protein FlhA